MASCGSDPHTICLLYGSLIEMANVDFWDRNKEDNNEEAMGNVLYKTLVAFNHEHYFCTDRTS